MKKIEQVTWTASTLTLNLFSSTDALFWETLIMNMKRKDEKVPSTAKYCNFMIFQGPNLDSSSSSRSPDVKLF